MLLKQPIDFVDLSANLTLEEEVFKGVEEDLFTDHDDDQILLQLCVVLVVEDIDEVRDVRIDELEHVRLVDSRVLPRLNVLMILLHHQVIRQFLVKLTENADEKHIDDTRDEVPPEWMIRIGFKLDHIVHVLEEDLSADNHEHAE